jgi:KinB signaling pathway activation protein
LIQSIWEIERYGGFLAVTIRNWFKFFLNAMWIGGLITGVLGLFIRWDDAFAKYFEAGQWSEFFAAFAFMVVMGFTISVITQMGFFAYLTIHQMGVNIFRTLTLWNWVQLLIIVIVIFDLIFFRFKPNAETTGQVWLYVILLLIMIATAVIVAITKAKITKKHTLISALFFMIVVSTLEWLPVLMVRADNVDSWVTLLLFPILAVNAYQLLALPKYNAKSNVDRKKLEERRKARKEAIMVKTK